jgi:hypothetical protein
MSRCSRTRACAIWLGTQRADTPGAGGPRSASRRRIDAGESGPAVGAAARRGPGADRPGREPSGKMAERAGRTRRAGGVCGGPGHRLDAGGGRWRAGVPGPAGPAEPFAAGPPGLELRTSPAGIRKASNATLAFRPLRPSASSAVRHQFPVALHGLFASFAYFAVDLRQSAKSVDQVQLAIGIIRATVEKGKHPASQKFFIPSRTRGYALSGRPARPEFRRDSCNTAPR